MSRESNHHPDDQLAANGAWDCPVDPSLDGVDPEYEAWLASLDRGEPCGQCFPEDEPEVDEFTPWDRYIFTLPKKGNDNGPRAA
jgi:hypothetical protein